MADAELKWLGLSDSKVAETVKNKALTEQLLSIIKLAKASGGSESNQKKVCFMRNYSNSSLWFK